MITANNLTKHYGDKHVLSDLSLSASASEITLLVGPNGAGKTTTVKIFAGLV
ncbi:MAG: ATP-binding cassette domain-containing protein, partial [Chthoniobacterales bacterium]